MHREGHCENDQENKTQNQNKNLTTLRRNNSTNNRFIYDRNGLVISSSISSLNMPDVRVLLKHNDNGLCA
jgi:hypothetical protein